MRLPEPYHQEDNFRGESHQVKLNGCDKEGGNRTWEMGVHLTTPDSYFLSMDLSPIVSSMFLRGEKENSILPKEELNWILFHSRVQQDNTIPLRGMMVSPVYQRTLDRHSNERP